MGIGYKTPTHFTEETETTQYQNVAQPNVKPEKSYGGTADVNFRTNFSENLSFTFNHMFFYTWINNPLVLESYATNNYTFFNATNRVESQALKQMHGSFLKTLSNCF